MAVFVVPLDYSEVTHPNVTPICVADTDLNGTPIHAEWIDLGVVPAAERLVRIAERQLSDRFRVSEITEHAVHSLSRRFGSNVGRAPDQRVLAHAHDLAITLRAGGRRARKLRDVELFDETLNNLAEQFDFVAAFEARHVLDRILDKVDELELHHVRELLPYILRDVSTEQLEATFRKSRNTITKRFYRGLRKAAHAAGITWHSGE